MPNYRKLTLLVSLAACERSDATTTPEPQFDRAGDPPPAPQPEARLEVAPVPAAEVQPLPEPKPAKAAVAPVKPKAVAKKPVIAKKPILPTEHELDRRCMSRAGCRWEREELKLRVTKKKQQQVEQRATPPESKQ